MEDIVDVDVPIARDLTMTCLRIRVMAHEEGTRAPRAGKASHEKGPPYVREKLSVAALVLQSTRGKMHEQRAR